MTEVEWLDCEDLTRMLIYLRGDVEPAESEPDPRPRLIDSHGSLVWGDGSRVSSARLGRFAHEVCKKWWELPLDELSRHLLNSYERFLTGENSWEEFFSVSSQMWNGSANGERPFISTMCQWYLNPFGMANLAQDLAWITACHLHRDRIEELERTASEDDRFTWGFFGYDFPEFVATAEAVQKPLPALLREIVGNPFRSVFLVSTWLTWNDGTIPKLAQAIYDEKRFEDMPILADALEEAGCTDTEILSHCRQPEEHIQGCWLIDLLLGKE